MGRYLITGCGGLLGANLADWILDVWKPSVNLDHVRNNIEVHGIDDLSGGYKENLHPDLKFKQMSVLDPEFVDYFAEIRPTHVWHLAAYAAEGLSPFIRCYNYDNNLKATASVVNCCIKHDVKRLCFTSTMAVYGEGEPPFDEALLPKPIDPYGVAKYAAEMDIQIAGEQHDLDWCIIRPHNVYGRKQNIWDKYRNVLGIWMSQTLNNEPMTIFGDGEQKRAFSYINDSVEPLFKAGVDPRASKQIINLGGIHEYSINEAADTLIKVMGKGEKKYLETRHEARYAYPTYQKSIDKLDYKHTTSLEDGLKDMWDWANTQPNRERFIWPFYELDNKIYSYWKN